MNIGLFFAKKIKDCGWFSTENETFSGPKVLMFTCTINEEA